MANLSILISNSEVSGPGGLFDINATLPLVAIQFVLLMVILNVLLYSPLLTVITERNEFILTNLAKASDMLAQANEMTAQYEEELSKVRKETQAEIANSQNNLDFLIFIFFLFSNFQFYSKYNYRFSLIIEAYYVSAVPKLMF